MKKTKLIMPLGIATLTGAMMPLVSCGCSGDDGERILISGKTISDFGGDIVGEEIYGWQGEPINVTKGQKFKMVFAASEFNPEAGPSDSCFAWGIGEMTSDPDTSNKWGFENIKIDNIKIKIDNHKVTKVDAPDQGVPPTHETMPNYSYYLADDGYKQKFYFVIGQLWEGETMDDKPISNFEQVTITFTASESKDNVIPFISDVQTGG